MLHQQELATAKYLEPVMKARAKINRRTRSRAAVRSFATFLMGLFMIPIAVELTTMVPKWIPQIQTYPIFQQLF